MAATFSAVGDMLRQWRQRRRWSQLDLAGEADVSARHVSFIETGRSVPSREMVLLLAERLGMPLRERNVLLLASGYAPAFRESPLDHPGIQAAREAVDIVLAGQDPCPALAFDRHWTLAAANKATLRLWKGVEPELLQPPVNVLRVALHPTGLAPRILNFPQWRSYIFGRLRRQIDASGDSALAQLLDEFSGYPIPSGPPHSAAVLESTYTGLVVRFQLLMEDATLSFFSTTTIFGSPVDITLSELAIESFFPADPATAETLRRLASSSA